VIQDIIYRDCFLEKFRLLEMLEIIFNMIVDHLPEIISQAVLDKSVPHFAAGAPVFRRLRRLNAAGAAHFRRLNAAGCACFRRLK
jgi:hypothetical protein